MLRADSIQNWMISVTVSSDRRKWGKLKQSTIFPISFEGLGELEGVVYCEECGRCVLRYSTMPASIRVHRWCVCCQFPFVFKHTQERGPAVLRQQCDGCPIGVVGAMSALPFYTTLLLSQWQYMSIAGGMELKLLYNELWVLLTGKTDTTCFMFLHRTSGRWYVFPSLAEWE